MDVIDSIWQIPGVAHFCFCFREAYKLPELTYDELEEALLTLGIDQLDKPADNQNGLREFNRLTEQNNGTIYNTTYLTNEPKDVLIQLICVLLRGCFHDEITLSNWETYLVKIFDTADENQSSPFFEKRVDDYGNVKDDFVPFHKQSIEKKAQILYQLCEYRLYSKERPHKIDELEEDELRVEPIGQDSEGCVYWYFFGTRLYKENPKATRRVEEKKIKINRLEKLELRTQVVSKRKLSNSKKANSLNTSANLNNTKVGFKNNLDLSLSKDDTKIVKPEISIDELKEAWCCVCRTEEDWIELTNKFKDSKNAYEKDLFNVLNDNFLPSMNQLFLKIKKNNERKLRFLTQRNSCRLMEKRFQQEEEERLRDLERQNGRENRAKRRANM